MRTHSLTIRNFRGIRTLDWAVPAGISCLIGPANSTKSTILDALDLLFTPRMSVTLSDADFFRCEVDNPMVVEAVVVNLPPTLADFDTYGFLHCGVTDDGTVVSDPEDGTTPAMVLRFRSDETLEPIWEVAKPGPKGETRPLRVGDRRRLGLFRIDEKIDQHFRWSRGSHLSALSGADTGGIGPAIAEAQRTARRVVFDADLTGLEEVAVSVSEALINLGGDPLRGPGVGLDPFTFVSGGSLLLHDEQVPFTAQGLGIKRLASLAIQRLRATDPSLLLVDEAEHGLEPHRLTRLLTTLHAEADRGTQVLLTTHSPVVVETLPATCLCVVRSLDGGTTVQPVPALLEGLSGEPQGTVRSGPAAMLARRVLVVEGATEEGLLRGLCRHWDTESVNLAMGGVAIRQGGSDEQALSRAECLARLGYESGALLDNDRDLTDGVTGALHAGVTVIRWAKGLSLEQQLARDLPADLLQKYIDLAVGLREDDEENTARVAVLQQIQAHLDSAVSLPDSDVLNWPVDIKAARDAIGRAAASKDKAWFKTNPKGEALGEFLVSHEAAIQAASEAEQGSDKDHLHSRLKAVRAFLYEGIGSTTA